MTDAVLVVWAVGTLAFVLLHLAPGDPIGASLRDPRVAPAVRAHFRAVYAFDRPLFEQYLRYVAAWVHGDLGYSFSQFRPVADALRETAPFSVLLMGLSLCLSALLGALIGTWQAVRQRSALVSWSAVVASGLSAVPEAWLALMLLAVFSAQFGLFPLSGRCDPVHCGEGNVWSSLLDLAHHLALPVLTLTLLFTAAFSRVLRVTLRDVLHDDVMRTARAKGVPSTRRLAQHAVRRAAGPFVATIGLSLPALVGGSVFVERIFGWPGMGTLLVGAIGTRDYPLVTAIAMAGSLLVVAGGTLTDVCSALLDPSVRMVRDA